MDVSQLKLGQSLRDNDPRMRGRTVTITELLPNGVRARDAVGRERLYLSHRIFADGKLRRSGLSIIP